MSHTWTELSPVIICHSPGALGVIPVDFPSGGLLVPVVSSVVSHLGLQEALGRWFSEAKGCVYDGPPELLSWEWLQDQPSLEDG